MKPVIHVILRCGRAGVAVYLGPSIHVRPCLVLRTARSDRALTLSPFSCRSPGDSVEGRRQQCDPLSGCLWPGWGMSLLSARFSRLHAHRPAGPVLGQRWTRGSRWAVCYAAARYNVPGCGRSPWARGHGVPGPAGHLG